MCISCLKLEAVCVGGGGGAIVGLFHNHGIVVLQLTLSASCFLIVKKTAITVKKALSVKLSFSILVQIELSIILYAGQTAL